MTKSSRRLLTLYLGALLALAYLGVQNQAGYHQHEQLLQQKRVLQLQLQGLRRDAALVNGTLAVRQWALKRGMVPAPEALNIREVEAGPAPAAAPLPHGELEVYTLWH